jgi:hypothetical protein
LSVCFVGRGSSDQLDDDFMADERLADARIPSTAKVTSLVMV